MPAGFHIASAYVDIHAEDGGLRAEIQNAVRSAVAGADTSINLDVQAGALRAKVESAVRSATAGVRGEVNLDLDAATLRARVSTAVASAAAGQRVRVGMDLDDAGRLRAGVAAATRAASAGAKVKVQLDLDSSAMSNKLRAAMRALDHTETIKTRIDVDAAGLRGKVAAAVAAAGAGQKIEVKMDVDRSNWTAAVAAMNALRSSAGGANGAVTMIGRSLSQIPGLAGVASAGVAGIGIAIAAVAVAAIVLLNAIGQVVGALAAIALPVGITAIGAALTTTKAQLDAFKASLMSLGRDVAAPMAGAVQGAMAQIMGALGQMRGQLTAMFANAGQLVQPLTTALTGLVSGALPGITAALSNMQSAMPGIISGFNQMGQGVGNFFRELTANGAAVGQVWATIGQGINRVATAFGQALSKIMSSPAAVQMLAQTFELVARAIDLAADAIVNFAPAINGILSALNNAAAAAGPFIQGLGGISTAVSGIMNGNPIGGMVNGFKQAFGIGKSEADKFKGAIQQIGPVSSQLSASSQQTAGAVRQQADAMRRAAEEAKKLDSAFGSGASQIKSQLDSAKSSADALASSLGRLGDLSRQAMGGEIGFAQAVLDAKNRVGELSGALQMKNGQLQLTSQKAIDAASSLERIATSGMQAAQVFAEQGNWAQAASQVDKTRAAITSLGQSFGLPKAQAQELANQLTTFADKEYTFKLNMEGARAGLDSVKSAFDSLTGTEKKVTVTAVTDSARAALEALGFQVKDLGNGKVEVTANTDAAKAALDGLQSVLDALSNKEARVNVSADQVPAVTAALQALGMKVESLPDGTVKVTAQDGASTIIDKVKGGIDGIPPSKSSNLSATGDLAQKAQDAQSKIAALAGKEVSLNGTGNLGQKAQEAKTAVDGIPASKSSVLNASGTAKTLAEAVRQQIDNIPGSKNTNLNASGNAKAESDAVKKAVEGLPPEKKIAVLVEVSQNATTALNELKKTMESMRDAKVSITINVLGKDGIAQVTADLKNLESKTVKVKVDADTGAAKSAINGLKAKDVKVKVTADTGSAQSKINGLKGKDVKVKVSADVGSAQSKINGLKGKDVKVKVTADVGSAQSAISGIKGKSVTIKVTESGVGSVQGKISGIKGKTVTINVRESGVGAVKAAIAGIKGKTVTVTVNVKKVGSVATGGYMDKETYGMPRFAAGGLSGARRNMTMGGEMIGPGTGTSDDILARLSNGEFVIRAAMVRKFGQGFFHALNAGVMPYSNMENITRFATGGLAGFHSGGSVTSASSAQMINYTVQRGDTLWALAKKFGSSVDELVRLNKIANRNLILIGQKLVIPNRNKLPGWQGTPGTGSSGVLMPGYGALPMAPPPTAGYAWHEVARKNPSYFTKGTSTNPGESIMQARRDLLGMTQVGIYGQLAGTTRGTFYHDLISANDMKSLIDGLYRARNAVTASDLVASRKNKLLSQLDAGALALMQNFVKLEKINAALADAEEALSEVKQQFDQLKNSVRENILEYGKITKIGTYGTSVNTLTSQLGKDVAKAEQFSSMLSALKARGLNSAMISEIGTAGIAGGGFATAQSLMNATPEQIAELNALQQTLAAHAEAAGTTVANSMYKAGLDAAQGLVDGLKAQQEAIKHVMRQIAASMELAIKQALGIASPSKVMHRLGEWTGLGLEEGIRSKVAAVIQAMRTLVETPGAVTKSGVNLPDQAIALGLRKDTTTGTIGGSTVQIGKLEVRIDGTFDLTNPAQRRAIAKQLVDEIKEEIRLSDRARAR